MKSNERLGEPPATIDVQMDALAHGDRRRLLAVLLEETARDPPVDVRAVPDLVDGRDEAVVMRHTHLPKLADLGYVQWDRESLVVSRGERFGEIEPLLTLLWNNADDLPGDWT